MASRKYKNIPIELFRSLVAIIRHGNFSKAAVELSLTQPAISGHIRRLQQLIGGDLFIKAAHGVRLTALGSVVERYAHRILALNDQVVALSGRKDKREVVNLGVQSTFARAILPQLAKSLSTVTTPDYFLLSGSAPILAAKLNSGYIDVCFTRFENEHGRNVLAEWYEKFVWMKAPDFEIADDVPIPFIIREHGFYIQSVLSVLADRDIPYKVVFSSSDLWTGAAAVESGIGIMPLPERVVPALSTSLVVANDPRLPMIPDMHMGVFFKEGFDLKRYRRLVEAFVSGVRPPRSDKTK